MKILVGSPVGLIRSGSTPLGQSYAPSGGAPTPTWPAHWLFNDGSGTDVLDSGPNGHNGTITGAGTTWGSGYLEFDGDGSYVNIPTIDLGTNSFQFIATVTATPPGSDYSTIFNVGGDLENTVDGFVTLVASNGTVYAHLIVSFPTNYFFVESTTNIGGAEHDIKVVVDRGNNLMTMLIDGVEEDSADITGLLSLSGAVGTRFGVTGSVRAYTGQIGDAELATI